jgi:hypothetical protein
VAEELGLEDDELRQYLRDEIQRRRRERGDAWKQLEETLEKRENGASAGDDPEAPPVHHQQHI